MPVKNKIDRIRGLVEEDFAALAKLIRACCAPEDIFLANADKIRAEIAKITEKCPLYPIQ